MRRLACFKQPIIIIFSLSFFIQIYCFSKDSTKQTYLNIIELKDDTNKVLQLETLSNDYRTINVDSALFIANLALLISEKINYDKGKAEALYQKSINFKNKGQFDSAIYCANLSRQIFEMIGINSGIANNYNIIGSILRRKGLLSSALENHKESLKVFTKTNDSLGLAKTYNYLGIIYKELAKYDSAVVYYLKLIRISEKIGFSTGNISGLLNISQVYIELNEYDKANYYLRISIQANESVNNKRNIALTYNKLGMVAYYQNELDTAIINYELSLQLYEDISENEGIGHLNINLGNVYDRKGNFKIALSKYNSAKQYFEKINYKAGIVRVYNNIATINEKQKKYQKSILYYDSALILATELGTKDDILLIYDNKYKIYKLLGNETQSLKYLEQYISLKDSIFNLEKTQIISDLELKYEKEKNEAEILALNLENLQKDLKIKKEINRKIIYMASGGLFFLVAIFLFLYFRQLIKKNKELAAQKLLKAEEEKKLSSAQALVEGQEEERIRISKELHDGVGVLLSTANLYLSTVADEAIKNKELISKAQKIVDDANTDVRKISRNLMPTILALHGLDEALHELIENIDQLPDKYGEFNVTGTPQAFSKPREVMVYRLIQELISNTMKHANAEWVDLELEYKEQDLKITYKDDGIGFDFDKALLKKSLGLKSIQSRVDYLKGQIEFNNGTEKGIKYVIRVPILEGD